MKAPAPDDPTGFTNPAAALFRDAHEGANRCIQCGYCLPVCPTYGSMGRETQSPRGRINLVKAAAEKRIDIAGDMARPLDLCLGCRACETACPVGVPYGEIFEAARNATAAATPGTPGPGHRLETLLLRHLFPHPARLRATGNLVWLAQVLGLRRLAFRTGLPEKLFPALAALGKVAPETDSPRRRPTPGSVFPARGKRRARVAFFQGCVMDALMHRINRLSIELLREAGCEVVIPVGQTCCGALHSHRGMRAEAIALARRNMAAFETTGADVFVSNAGGCGARLHETDHLFAGDPDREPRARRFARKWRDLSSVLDELGPLPLRRECTETVTYQDSCHLRHVQNVSDPPRRLLRAVAGDRYREMRGAADCCASGGIYNLLHFDESMKILDPKMHAARDSGATVIVTTNPGCHLQMRLGIDRAGLGDRVRAVHLAEILAECVWDNDHLRG